MNCRLSARAALLILGLFLLSVLAGCASGGGGGRSRGKLSAATAEAAGEEEETGRGRGATRTKNEDFSSDSYAGSGDGYDSYGEDTDDGDNFLVSFFASLFSGGGDDEPEEEPPHHLTDYSQTGNRTWGDTEEFGLSGEQEKGGGADIERGNLNLWFSRSRLAGDTIQRFTNYTLMYSWYKGPRLRLHAGLYYGRGKPGSQENLTEGLRWVSETGADFGLRRYLTPKHSLMGLYMIAGLRAGVMYWSYTNGLQSRDEEGNPETISHDGLVMFTPYLGVGASLLQTGSVHLGVNFTWGGRLSVDKTYRDYENDIFKHVAEYRLNIEASIFF